MLFSPKNTPPIPAVLVCKSAAPSINNDTALIRGLEIGLELNIINIQIYADSELVVKQVSGEYKVKHERMRPLHRKAIALLSQYSNWSLQHVPRDDNTIADKLSKEGRRQGR